MKKIIYEEEIYPSYMLTAKGAVIVFTNGVQWPSEMPVIVFSWWGRPRGDRIVAMSHQSLQ